ncbi:MAG: GSCFA domain-containing protein [Paludibacter sp.]
MFTTKIDINPSEFHIDYLSKIVTLGSCFSENIGSKLKTAYFDVDVNPFGVLFNPISIKQSIELALIGKQFTEHDLFQHNSLWNSFYHSSHFSDADIDKCLEKINSRLMHFAINIKSIDYLVITFGTAWVYKHHSNGKVVSNCHKLPASTFERYRLSAEEIVMEYTELIRKLQLIHPNLNIIFSVSPVRHWKDGPTENNISKGILLQAIQLLEKECNHVSYFPAYEIVVDELRDYRFYASDMLHPSELAVDYIFSNFKKTFFQPETEAIYNELVNYSKAIHHKPTHIDTPEYEKFMASIQTKRTELINKYSFLKLRL